MAVAGAHPFETATALAPCRGGLAPRGGGRSRVPVQAGDVKGMGKMSTQTITSSVKERQELLLRRAEQLRRELQAARESAQPAASAAGAEVEDLKDRAAQSEASVVSDAEQERDLDELAQVEAALARLAAGRYGECADCGEPIGEARLAAMPAAECCAGCQARREREREQHSAGAARHG